jgi:hypothetical protein
MWVARLALLSLCTTGCNLYFGDGDDDGVTPDAWVIDVDGGFVDVDAPPPDGGTGFILPTATTRANTFANGAWQEVGPADWSCLGMASTDQPSTGPIQLGGRVVDVVNNGGVGAAAITAYAPSTSGVVGTGTSSNGTSSRGEYLMTVQMLPSTSTRYTFVLSARDYAGTYVLDQYIAPAASANRDLPMVATATMSNFPAMVGLTRIAGTAFAIGDIVDCQGRAVSNAVAIASRSRNQLDLIPGAAAYYFSAGSTSVPVRGTVSPTSNRDGRFMLANVPSIQAGFSIQILGFRTSEELGGGTLALLGQLWAPAQPDAAVIATVEPRRN